MTPLDLRWDPNVRPATDKLSIAGVPPAVIPLLFNRGMGVVEEPIPASAEHAERSVRTSVVGPPNDRRVVALNILHGGGSVDRIGTCHPIVELRRRRPRCVGVPRDRLATFSLAGFRVRAMGRRIRGLKSQPSCRTGKP